MSASILVVEDDHELRDQILVPDLIDMGFDVQAAGSALEMYRQLMRGRVDAVVQLTKQGFAFVFDRVTGRPGWPLEERAVPRSLGQTLDNHCLGFSNSAQ